MQNQSESQFFQFLFEETKAERLDKFLVRCMPEFSRARLQGLIKDGKVTVAGKVATKSGYVVEPGSQVNVELPPTQTTDLVAEDIPLDIIFESDDLLVVNKAAGMVVHPALGHWQGTLVNAALGHDPEMEGVGGELRPGIVHRLDKNTSGLIVIAKNDDTLHLLQDQFRLRQVRKIYLALTDGHPPTPTGRIEAAIGRDPSQRKQMAIVSEEKGRSAESEYLTLETYPHHSLLEVHPLTGRTHQIRLHLAFLGCPVVGDTIYGRQHSSLPLGRHFLHAARLTITLPGETEPRTFEAPLPPDLAQVLNDLRGK
jgi:23S rRNA pseudouridine1911/1915/1917 synthase